MKVKEKLIFIPIILLVFVSTIILIGIVTNKQTGATENTDGWDCTVKGHQYVGTQTCTTAKYCEHCGLVINPALGHSPVVGETIPPTCTTPGSTPSTTCSRCGITLNSSTSIPALNHNNFCKSDGTKNIVNYTKTATQHIPIAVCTICSKTEEQPAEAHTGATHPDGKCTVCGQVYQTHSKGAVSYTKTATQHTSTYKCSYSGCTETYAGTTEAHTGGTHANGGKCTVCGQVYQTHSKGAVSYTKTATQHTSTYKCSYSGCTETYAGTTEAHTGATHPDGKCTVCGQVYQTHSKGNIDSYTKTTTGHTPIYKCSYSGCTETYTGTAEAHIVTTWTDNKDGTHIGSCTACQYNVSESHTFSNGECTVCKAKSEGNAGTGTGTSTEGWTDTSKISIKLTDISNGVDSQNFKISIEGITTNKDSQYYLYLTNGNNKPKLSVSSSNWIDSGYYISKNGTEFQNFSMTLISEGEEILEKNGYIYAWIVESKNNSDNKRENQFILEGYKVDRPALYGLGKRIVAYFFNDKSYVSNHNINGTNSQGKRKVKVKIGTIDDSSILNSIKNNESGALNKLLTYSKSASSIYTETLPLGTSASIIDKVGVVDGKYYYAYLELDDENGKYYPVEDVMLYQGKKGLGNKLWLCNYGDSTFTWNNVDNNTNNGDNNNNNGNNNNNNNNGNNNSTNTPQDSTIKPGKLPQTGATPIFITAVIATIGVAGFAVYKMKKLKDVK